jgi:hypothetical protein
MNGTVAILSVGAGDTKLSFDPKNPKEVARSAKIVKDMIRRGFVLLIEVGRDEKGPLYRRALDFDESAAEYIIAGDPDDVEPSREKKGRRGRPRTRIAASRTSALSVARTAGG